MSLFFDYLGCLQEEKDLIVFDIPQLTVYCNREKTKRYLSLVEDDDGNELLFSEVEKNDLIGLLECRTPLRSLFEKNKYDYLAKWDNSAKKWVVKRELVGEIDNSFLPIKDECFEQINEELKNYLLKLKGFSDVPLSNCNIITYGDSVSKRKRWKFYSLLSRRKIRSSSVVVTNVAIWV